MSIICSPRIHLTARHSSEFCSFLPTSGPKLAMFKVLLTVFRLSELDLKSTFYRA